MKFIELFAGIGGFRYGLENVGFYYNNGQAKMHFKCVWANEIDKYACQIYRKNYREGELYEGDIAKVNTDDIPDGWTEFGTEGKISDTQRYKCCGNAIVVAVVKEVVSRLIISKYK